MCCQWYFATGRQRFRLRRGFVPVNFEKGKVGGNLMARTISNSYASGITVSNTADNPLTVLGTIDAGTGNALTATAPVSWNISNKGVVEAAGSGNGVVLPLFGSSLDNVGTISGTNGVEFGFEYPIGFTSTLSNEGLISGASVGVYAGYGVTITNSPGGLILGGTTAIVGTSLIRMPVSIDNAGTISSDAAGTRSTAIYVRDPTTIINEAGGLINSSGGDIVSTYYFGGVILNSGTISNAATYNDPALKDPAIKAFGVDVTNFASGRIFSHYQAIPYGDSISNVGTIIALDLAVRGVDVTNAVGAAITSGLTLAVYSTGTVTNSGTIATDAGGAAVQFAAGSADLLVVAPGATFIGTVDGGNTVGGSAVSVLELTAGSDTLTGVGSSFVNFGSIAFDPGAAWTVSGSLVGLAGGQTISGFAPGDTIELTHVNASYVGFAAGTLTLSDGIELLMQGSFSGLHFEVTPVVDNRGTNTDITVACFRAGTRIRTERGEVAVEELRVGDRVPAVRAGISLPVVWIGYRDVNANWYSRPEDVYPVRVAAGAFADFVPHRDLWLSPEHCVFLHGVLVPIRVLINGTSVSQVPCDEVTYWHVELASHDLMLCEGAWAESYLDMGNRAAFTGTGDAQAPDFSRGSWEARACQQQERGGPVVAAIRAVIDARSLARKAVSTPGGRISFATTQDHRFSNSSVEP
jgi:hypothetical protein